MLITKNDLISDFWFPQWQITFTAACCLAYIYEQAFPDEWQLPQDIISQIFLTADKENAIPLEKN